MKEQLISFETAKLAKENMFKVPCTGYYNTTEPDRIIMVGAFNHNTPLDACTISAPTQALLQKWLRENHKMEVSIYCNASGWLWEINKAFSKENRSGGTFVKWSEYSGPNESGEWLSYEEALEEGLLEALKLVK